VSINLFNGHLYVSSKTGELSDLVWEALRLGGSGLYLNSTATASSVALACGSFSVTANGSL
jgi:hypothetical protein